MNVLSRQGTFHVFSFMFARPNPSLPVSTFYFYLLPYTPESILPRRLPIKAAPVLGPRSCSFHLSSFGNLTLSGHASRSQGPGAVVVVLICVVFSAYAHNKCKKQINSRDLTRPGRSQSRSRSRSRSRWKCRKYLHANS